MIKDFRGQVKVADVQAAFNEIVNNINGLVDSYNQASDYAGADYTKGSPSLSAPSYTLSVGGLKTVLTNYNNTLIGCNIFKIDDLSCLVTEGLYITSDRVYRIPSQYVVGEAGWDMSELYYDKVNEVLMFKDGSHGAIVAEQTVFNQPTINSNTEYGVFYFNYNSQNAYKCTTSEGVSAIFQSTGVFEYPTLTWELPSSVKINSISLNANATVVGGSSTIVVKCDEDIVYSGAAGNINISLTNRDTSKIIVYAQISNNIFGFNVKFSDLLVQGTSSSIAIEQGGVVTPSDSIVKVCDLNWKAKDGLIKDFKQAQLEKPIGYTLNNSDKNVLSDNHWMNNDPLDTTNSGKFAAYSMLFAQGNDYHYGYTSILGQNIILNRENEDPEYRNSGVAFPMSILYIPKGCTDNMSSYCNYSEGSSTGVGRTVTDPIFKYDP